MRKSHFNDEFLVLLGPIMSRFFACSNEGKNKPKQQRVIALALSQWCFFRESPRQGDQLETCCKTSTCEPHKNSSKTPGFLYLRINRAFWWASRYNFKSCSFWLNKGQTYFRAFGFFSWVTDKKSSWTLLYFQTCQSIHTQIKCLN
jgi:hypothetical protein